MAGRPRREQFARAGPANHLRFRDGWAGIPPVDAEKVALVIDDPRRHPHCAETPKRRDAVVTVQDHVRPPCDPDRVLEDLGPSQLRFEVPDFRGDHLFVGAESSEREQRELHRLGHAA
jgi:hypothetical protein